MKRGKSYRIALCSMSVTLAVLILGFGHSLGLGEFFWYFVASQLIDMPERISDKALCYGATVCLAAILCGFNFVYLASFGLLMGPYIIVKAAVRNKSPMFRRIVMAAFWFAGLLAVCWCTPMFFVQLSITESANVRITAIAVIAAVSIVIESAYGRLYGMVNQIFRKVWSRFL